MLRQTLRPSQCYWQCNSVNALINDNFNWKIKQWNEFLYADAFYFMNEKHLFAAIEKFDSFWLCKYFRRNVVKVMSICFVKLFWSTTQLWIQFSRISMPWSECTTKTIPSPPPFKLISCKCVYRKAKSKNLVSC